MDVDDYVAEVWREVARNGIDSSVCYVVPNAAMAHAHLVQRINDDQSSGMRVSVATVSEIPDNIFARGLADVTIVDSCIVAVAPLVGYNQSLGTAWRVSIDDAEVAEASVALDAIQQIGRDITDFAPTLDLEEPLAQSAHLIDQIARVLCVGDHVDPTGCGWYHSTWQYLRLTNMVSTPAWHHDFYLNAIKEKLVEGARSVLITGTADYSVLAYVIHAARDAGVETRITVVDLCPTPLFACQWFASQVNVDVNPIQADIFDVTATRLGKFDLIVTDAFLTRFNEAERQLVLNTWSRHLEDGGSVITTVRSHAESQVGQGAEDAIQSFRDRAIDRWHKWESFIGMSSVQIGERAEFYAKTMVTNQIGDELSILSMLGGQFEVESSQLAQVPGELVPTKYLRVIMSRK
jgi:hypothetical protein